MCLAFAVCCQAICCMGRGFCDCCCSGLKKCGLSAKTFPKVGFVVLDICFMIIAMILMYTLRPLFKDNDWLECNDASGGGYDCFGTAAALRASFTLFLFHTFILLIMIPRGNCAMHIHDGWFTAKFIVLLAVYILTFWIHNDFFKAWADICRAGSVVYMFVQAYFLLNFSYLWNDELWEAKGKDQCYAHFLLCGFSIILSILCSVWLAFQFVWYAGCAIGVFVLIITIAFFIIFYTISLLKLCEVDLFRPNATVFVVGFVNTYLVFLSWSALASHPDEECNEMIDNGANTFFQILIGSIFCFINLYSIATATAKGGNADKTSMGQGLIEEEKDAEVAKDEERGLFPVTGATMFFQGVMLLVSLYFGMLFTNWGYAIIDIDDDFAENAYFSMWVKLIT